VDPTPHRPEAKNPLDELTPTLRAAVEAARRQPVPSDAQEQALRRVEEELSMKSTVTRPFWTNPAVAAAVLAASVAVAFCAGYAMRPPAAQVQNTELAQNKPQEPEKIDPEKITAVEPGDINVPYIVEPKVVTTTKSNVTEYVPLTKNIPNIYFTENAPTPGTAHAPVVVVPATGYVTPTSPPIPGPSLPVPAPGAMRTYTTPANPTDDIGPIKARSAPMGKPAPDFVPGEKGMDDLRAVAEVTRLKAILSTKEKLLADKITRNYGRKPEDQKGLEEAMKQLPAEKRARVLALAQLQANPQQPGQGQPQGEGVTGENYNYFVDNAYIAVQNAPLSTFSTSVDTASYSNIRRMLNAGQLPPKDAVRIADMVNYFPYSYPAPKGNDPVSFAMNMADCPWNGQHQLLRVAVAARTYTADQMPPRNFVFLLDTSGSMGPENRLPLLIKSLKLLVAQLRAQDRVAIVVYAGSAGLVLDSTAGNEKDTILGSLDRLHAGGSTNGGDGIRLAYKVATANYIKGGVNRVILGTDGDFNVGTTDQADLIRMIEENRKTNVFLTVLGFGYGNLKDATMERLAHHGNGYFAYIDNEAEGKKVFVEQGGALAAVAKDVKIQIEFNPQRVAGYRLIGYENKLLRDQDFNNDKIDAGDMGSGHTVTALYEIVPAGTRVPEVDIEDLKYAKPTLPAEAANTGEFLTVKMRFKDPEADTSKKLEQPLSGAVEKFEKANDEFRWAAAVVEFGLLLRDSPYKGKADYAHVIDTAEKALGTEDAHRVEFLALVKKAREIAKAAEKKE